MQTPCRTLTAPSSECRRHVLNVMQAATVRLPTLVWRPRSGGSRSNFGMKLILQKVEGCVYCMVKIAWSLLQPFSTDPPVWQTDGFAIAYSALSMLSRAKNAGNSTLRVEAYSTCTTTELLMSVFSVVIHLEKSGNSQFHIGNQGNWFRGGSRQGHMPPPNP